MKNGKRFKSILLILILSLPLMACEGGKGEKAGERVDEAVDNMKKGDSPFRRKGAGEKAGEAVDEAVDSVTDKK